MSFRKQGDTAPAKIYCSCGAELKPGQTKCAKCQKDLAKKQTKVKQ